MLKSIRRYLLGFINQQKDRLSHFSFGAVSAVLTCLALITSFDTSVKSKMMLVGSLCIIALADNISDTLGIHIYKEGERSSFRDVWKMTLSNFGTRLGVILIFIVFVLALPPTIAVVCSIVYGFLILATISYLVAKKRHVAPQKIIIEHIFIATMVLILSKYITYLIKLWL